MIRIFKTLLEWLHSQRNGDYLLKNLNGCACFCVSEFSNENAEETLPNIFCLKTDIKQEKLTDINEATQKSSHHFCDRTTLDQHPVLPSVKQEMTRTEQSSQSSKGNCEELKSDDSV